AYGMLEPVEEDLEHWRAKGPVGKLHNSVNLILASPQRTEAFKAHAKEQEEADIYKLAEESTAELEVIQNNATRWNSTYMMIERALIKQSKLNSFIQELGLEADASIREPELATGVKSTSAWPSTVGQIRERPSRQSRLLSRLQGHETTLLHRRRETALPARPLTSPQFNENALPGHSREDYLPDDARSQA
ncbi:hypothetical protein IL306_012724, partial [Fusarium sp. DS 682]